MRKYWQVFITTVKEYFVYRLNFILWRFRALLNLIVIFFLWYSVLENKTGFGRYNREEMLSYIIFANLIIGLVLGTRTAEIAGDINNGNIINFLLKPISFFKFYFVRDLADKAINVIFAMLEVFVLVKVFSVSLVAPANIPLFLFFLLAGVVISFFVNLALSFVGFWTTEVWAPRFVFFMIVSFLSGAYFPLDILPRPIYLLLLATPFPYLYFLPTQILIKQAGELFYFQMLLAIIWVFLSGYLVKRMWQTGNKSFSFWGR